MDRRSLLAALAALAAAPARAAAPDEALVQRLRRGGLVLLMRHAHAPAAPPAPGAVDPANLAGERQLDEAGRQSAQRLGEALEALQIRIGEVDSSPTFRAVQTVRLAGLGQPSVVEALGDGGRSMSLQAAASAGRPDWIRNEIRRAPPAGRNRLIVTHQPNILAALGDGYRDLQDGEMLVIDPATGAVLGRIPIDAWPGLAARGRKAG